MATPPYSIDTSDPTSTTAIASYPANEQANRNTINSWLLGISDATTGYAYMPLAKRVGFSVTATVEYRPDFYMGEDDIYVWGKVNRIVNAPSFRLGYVEGALADAATAMTPLGTMTRMQVAMTLNRTEWVNRSPL